MKGLQHDQAQPHADDDVRGSCPIVARRFVADRPKTVGGAKVLQRGHRKKPFTLVETPVGLACRTQWAAAHGPSDGYSGAPPWSPAVAATPSQIDLTGRKWLSRPSVLQ